VDSRQLNAYNLKDFEREAEEKEYQEFEEEAGEQEAEGGDISTNNE